jgi:hypothetical protein
MCGGSPPPVKQTDPKAEAEAAAAKAAAEANADQAGRRARKRQSSLLTSAGTLGGQQSATTVLTYGKSTLGS